MGRPAASPENKKLSVAIAFLLTRQTDNSSDTIARCGKCSIFAVLKILCPTIIRENNTGPRDGISEIEFNKALQVCTATIQGEKIPLEPDFARTHSVNCNFGK
jgi:hypothetical protein